MSTKKHEMQRFIRFYKEQTGKKQVEMREVAKLAVLNGWPLPEPVDPYDRLTKQFTDAAREEIRYDKKTGKPYRANHAVPRHQSGGAHQYDWIDIDEAPRKPMMKSLVLRRDQMVGDAYHLTLDADHWNSIHSDEEPITLPLDFTDDVNWRKNGPEEMAS
jgi:hypothetical protein